MWYQVTGHTLIYPQPHIDQYSQSNIATQYSQSNIGPYCNPISTPLSNILSNLRVIFNYTHLLVVSTVRTYSCFQLYSFTRGIFLANGSSNDNNNDTASIWMAVIQAFIPYMPASMVTLLYRTVRPLLSVNESISLQKRAYYVLDALLKSHEAYLTNSSESRVQMLGLVSESLLTCQVSARSMRLRCMETILVHMSDEELSQATGSVLGEVLICQKDANKKTRDRYPYPSPLL